MIRLIPLLWLLVCSPLAAQDKLLLVSHKAASSLDFYTTEGEHLASVRVGKHPHEMLLSPDGRYAYTTDNGTMAIEQAGEGGNTVSIVDLAARKKIVEISLGEYHRPHGIDIDADGKQLYVTTENPDRLLVIDLATRRVVKTYDTRGKTSHIVTLGRDGKWAYVSNSRSASVSAINLETGETEVIPTADRPEGSVLSNDGKELYVVNREGGSISVIDTHQKKRVAEIKTGDGPVRVGITPDDRTLVYALLEGQKIGFVDARRRKVITEIPAAGRLVSLHLSPDGKYAFASAQWDDTVYVVSVPERRVVRTLNTLAGGGPDPVLEISANERE
jgi:YVTN family beta-propeller protein